MSAFRAFLVGLFTKHLGTKALALLLSVILFVFFFQTLSGQREVRSVALIFELGTQVRTKYVLLTPRVELKDVQIKGLRSKVDPAARKLQLEGQVRILVNEAFLRELGIEPDGTRAVSIPIDREFFRRQPILEEGVELATDPEQAAGGRADLVLDPRDLLELRITLADPELARLPETSPYRAASDNGLVVAPSFRPELVRLSGPREFFADDADRLHVRIPAVGTLTDPHGLHPVTGIDWEKSGIDEACLDHLDIISPPGMRARDLAKAIQFSVSVVSRGEDVTVAMPIRVVDVPGGTGLNGLQFEGALAFTQLTEEDIADGVAKALRVTKQEALLDLEGLVLVLDLTAADVSDRTVTVPVHLGVDDPSDRSKRQLLDHVSLTRTADGEPVVRFSRQP